MWRDMERCGERSKGVVRDGEVWRWMPTCGEMWRGMPRGGEDGCNGVKSGWVRVGLGWAAVGRGCRVEWGWSRVNCEVSDGMVRAVLVLVLVVVVVAVAVVLAVVVVVCSTFELQGWVRR